MSRSLSINLYLRYFSIAIYGKFDLYYLRLFRLLVCRLYNVCISVFLIVTVYYYWLLLNLCCKVIFLKSLFLCTFWRLKVLVLWRKTVQNLLNKNFHHSGMVSRRKLPDTLLNRFFNALPIGVQYTFLFHWMNFGLKCLLLAM